MTEDFGKIRKIFWPVHNFEIKKVLPMALIMFCILFNYTVMRDTKDALIATARGAGAEAIPYIKGILVVVSSLVFMTIYIKASSIISKERLFYLTVGIFLTFFGVFAYVIYPLKDVLHPSLETINSLKEAYPNFIGLWATYAAWTYAAFYVMAELWGSVGISLLFWQFANEIVRPAEARRFYALFGMFANIALLISGPTVTYFSQNAKNWTDDSDPWALSLKLLMGSVVVMGAIAMITYRWMHTTVLTNPVYYDGADAAKAPKKKKAKLSIVESFKLIMGSPYIGLVAILVLAYGMSINLVEVTWKKQASLQYTNPNDYNGMMGQLSFFTGITAIVMTILGGNILRVFGWLKTALTTPIVIISLGGGFFLFTVFGPSMESLVNMIADTPLYASVILGFWVVVVAKAIKYAFFDPTKEMAYIPLDENLKVQGKAAVDVVGGRLGKAGGSYTFILLGMIVPGASLVQLAPYTATIFVIVVGLWLVSVFALSKRVDKATKDYEEQRRTAV